MKTTKEECLKRAELLNDEEIMPIIERMAAECDWPEAIGLSTAEKSSSASTSA